MNQPNYSKGIHLVDFEFHPAHCREGNQPVPVCMVVRAWPSGFTRRYWQDELGEIVAADRKLSHF